MQFATIGVYEFDAEGFLEALAGARIGAMIDVRQRRGVRGSRYAWANSKRLQSALAEAGIEYRADLSPIAELAAEGRRPALLCIERDPEACHRSLIAERLVREHRLTVEHIRPAS